MTPERLAAMEAAAADQGAEDIRLLDLLERTGNGEGVSLDEEASPVAGRRFTR
jgi:hypothetical protein